MSHFLEHDNTALSGVNLDDKHYSITISGVHLDNKQALATTRALGKQTSVWLLLPRKCVSENQGEKE